MKTIILAMTLIFSLSASAQVYIYPTVFNMGYSAQVQVNNTSKKDINCSGTLHMHTMLGRMETGFYHEYIRAGGFSMRSFYVMNMNDRINYTTHSIYCRQAN